MLENRELIRDSFYIPKNLAYFNTGTFGICPRPVLEAKIKFLREVESNPAFGFYDTMFHSVLENQKILAQKFGVDSQNLAFIQNVTQGINTVLHSINVKDGEEILITNYTYRAIQMTTEEIFGRKGGIIRKLEIKLPIESMDQIVNMYVNFVKKYPGIKYAIIDHIPSAIPLIQPVKEIVKALKHLGVFVIIDGAHTPGQIKDLNVGDIGANVYIGNLHKWCFAPRPVAFMAIGSDCDIKIENLTVSFLHNNPFSERFLYSGTYDFTNFLCVKKSFQFIGELGGLEEISRYNIELLDKGIKYLEKSWNVTAVTFPQNAPFMRLIPFPGGFQRHSDKILEMLSQPFERPYYKFAYEKLGFIAAAYPVEGKLHFRLCCQIFVEYEHFVQFSDAVFRWLELLDKEET